MNQNYFNQNAETRFHWIKKAKHYYSGLKKYYNFHSYKNAKVVEIGFGTGLILASTQPKLGIAIDMSENLAAKVKKQNPNFETFFWNDSSSEQLDKVLDEVKKKLGDGADFIFLVNTVGYWDDIQFALTKLKKICKPSTRIIANYYNFLWAPIFKIAQFLRLKMPQPNFNWLSLEDVSNLFQISGYRIIKKERYGLLPFNFLFLGAFFDKILSPLPIINKLCISHFVIARPENKIDPQKLKVSIVVPARNEKGNIEPIVRRINELTKYRKEKFEVIFVEGNSTDNTYEEIVRVLNDSKIEKNFEYKLLKQPGRGKGDAVRAGFQAASGDLFLILDADITVPVEDIPKFLDVYCEGYGEFINGCRLVYKMEKEAMRFLNLLGNKFFSMMFTWILGQRFKDTLCGTKVISRENYFKLVQNRSYFGDFDPFGDFDLIFGASKLDLEIVEVPIRYRERTYGSTNISRFKHGWLLLKMTFFAIGKIKFF